MNNRPKIKVKLSLIDKIVESIGLAALAGVWIFTLSNYSSLPETIPIHYNLVGEVDSFGEKGNILFIPIISTILFIIMTILNKYPHSFNYLKTITEENAHYQYANATRLIRLLKLNILIIFGGISFETIGIAKGNFERFGILFLPLTLGLIFIPIFYYLIKSSNEK
ncbi:MAG: hypothetical protein CR982_06070 [Candidatus Cloacimonadota bacterium]|nr:MAG: hypothetical protein CR982_06070 [Candidatus Cloacimonadota bacterium]PIE78086.1 MAG: hypothetical protein CSA15_09630 [Candidatus Delongbacteria bacterium]